MRSLRSLIDPGGGSLSYHVGRLRDTLSGLAGRLRAAVSAAVGEAVAGAVRDAAPAEEQHDGRYAEVAPAPVPLPGPPRLQAGPRGQGLIAAGDAALVLLRQRAPGGRVARHLAVAPPDAGRARPPARPGRCRRRRRTARSNRTCMRWSTGRRRAGGRRALAVSSGRTCRPPSCARRAANPRRHGRNVTHRRCNL
jgi:hypothetical protein